MHFEAGKYEEVSGKILTYDELIKSLDAEIKEADVAKNVMQTKISSLVQETETDYSTWVRLSFKESKMNERGVSVQDIADALQSNKKFKTEPGEMQLLLRLNDESDSSSVITIRNKVLNTTVKGVSDVERVTVVQKDGQWSIQTTGSNLAKILEVPRIDKRSVRTNNVFEIAETLGIEAARNALIRELTTTLEDQGLEVDIRYIMLVADLMCSRGHMQQIGRHGVAGTKDSVLARAAFEITVPTIAHAALAGEVEQLKGVTENVIVGSNIPIGSGTVDLYMQVSKKREDAWMPPSSAQAAEIRWFDPQPINHLYQTFQTRKRPSWWQMILWLLPSRVGVSIRLRTSQISEADRRLMTSFHQRHSQMMQFGNGCVWMCVLVIFLAA